MTVQIYRIVQQVKGFKIAVNKNRTDVEANGEPFADDLLSYFAYLASLRWFLCDPVLTIKLN